jgi:hypothetical protein
MEFNDLLGKVLTWLLTPSSPPWRGATKKPIESTIQVITAGTGLTSLCLAARKLIDAGFQLGIASTLQLSVFGFLGLPMLLMILLFWTSSEFQTAISDVIDWLFRAWTCVLLLLLGLGLYYSSKFGLTEGGQLPFYAQFWPTYLICVGFTTLPMILRFWYQTETRLRDCAIGAFLLFGTSILAALLVMRPAPFWFPPSVLE